MLPRKTSSTLLGLGLLAAATAGCKAGNRPVILPLEDVDALVGQTLSIVVVAVDPDGDALTYRFEAANVPDLNKTATQDPGSGIFTFRPLASQLGTHIFDFFASDKKLEGQYSIEIDVRGAVGSGSAPVFINPTSGGILNLEDTDTMVFQIDIMDPDSTSIELTEAPPTIQNAELHADDNGLSGTWEWQPSREQIESSLRYDMTLSADDGDNPPTLKKLPIFIRRRSGAECPGDAPVIFHEPTDFATVQDLLITAHIKDDLGLGTEPFVAFSLQDPGNPVMFDEDTHPVEMTLDSGDMREGVWSARIPNPVASEPEGTEGMIYYLISASDNDDIEGDCDHRVDAPSTGTYAVKVTNAPGMPGVPCAPCSADAQCGEHADLCIQHPDGNFCGADCSGDGDCDGASICSPNPVDSANGASARQCIPNSGSCANGGGNCADDDDEPNGGPTSAAGPLPAGTHDGLTLCPGDEDWFKFAVSNKARVTATLSGQNPPDMDLALTTSTGVLVDASIGLTSDEEVVSPSCLDPGTYMLRVYSEDSAPKGDYSLTYALSTTNCDGNTSAGQGDCCVDNNSPGCMDLAIQTCACTIDGYCCNTEWDDKCAAIATDDCNADCGGGGGENLGCCTAQSTPGCTNAAIEFCVCAADDFCCGANDGVWDATCVNEVGTLLCAGACAPDDNDGDCCDPNNQTPGCEINSIENCVCAADPLCCDEALRWEQTCVNLVGSESCAQDGASCPGPPG